MTCPKIESITKDRIVDEDRSKHLAKLYKSTKSTSSLLIFVRNSEEPMKSIHGFVVVTAGVKDSS